MKKTGGHALLSTKSKTQKQHCALNDFSRYRNINEYVSLTEDGSDLKSEHFTLNIKNVKRGQCVHSCRVTKKPDKFNPDQCYSRLHSLAVTGHVHLQVIRVVQHLGSKQIILQVTPQLRKLEQFTIIKYSPAGRVREFVNLNCLFCFLACVF